MLAFGGNNTAGPIDVATACRAKGGSGHNDFESETFVVAHTLRGEGFDASEDGTGCAERPHAVAFDCKASGSHGFGVGDIAPTLRAMGRANGRDNGGGQVAVAFQSATEFLPQSSRVYSEHEKAPALQASGHRCGNRARRQSRPAPRRLRVRRLTPRECERLQGMPDDWTLIPRRNGKPAKDGPRYKAIGNSFAVPCVAWIGRRIEAVEAVDSQDSQRVSA